MKKDFLLEIGCENLPSGYINGALRQLEETFERELGSFDIQFDSIYVTGTPNRLVVRLRGLPGKQEASVTTVTGPPVSVAVAGDGSWTKAAEGFARKQGVTVDQLMRVETGRGEYLAVQVEEKGRAVDELLSAEVPGWITSIRFPKVMKWDGTDLRFARPIRWVLALLGDDLLGFGIGSLQSAAATRLSPYFTDDIAVGSQKEYFALLKKSKISLDREEREAIVLKEARGAAESAGGELVEDAELVSMVANLVESPVVMTGAFDRKFLELPREVIVTALKSHQRYFSVQNSNGDLLPEFIAFADGARKNKAEILKGYERVLQARLEDAGFYYREDTSVPLEKMAERLGGIVWLEGLGTLADKAGRVAALARRICEVWRPGDERLAGRAARSALLAKADLASEMVKDGKEFTKLQGYIGREYAIASGEEQEVCDAIFEHYLPRFSGDELPSSEAGTVLALSDRLDTIAGCFIQGFAPTGSQDPYALRRQAFGVLRVCFEMEMPLDIRDLLRISIGQFGEDALAASGQGADEILAGMTEMFSQRLNTMLRDEGLDYDLVSATLSAPWEFPDAVRRTARRLQEMRDAGALSEFVLAMKRIVNILPREYRRPVSLEEGISAIRELSGGGGEARTFDADLFEESEEDSLLAAAERAAAELQDLGADRGNREIDVLARLVTPVNSYFDAVLVNCDDKSVRKNRISFLLALSRACGRFCYFSEIVVDQTQ